MSKLESAFTKAMREQSPKPSVNINKKTESRSLETTTEGELAVAPVPNAVAVQEAVPAKRQIRNMSGSRKLTDEELAKKGLVYPRMKDRRLLNVYRNLRTKLLATSPSSNFITLITSVSSSVSSSIISANIAATFAFDEGKTALLIDGNVQFPTLARLFDLQDENKGLMECLESESLAVSDILYETGIPRLRFIPAGRCLENSAEYYNSTKMKQLISELCERYPERYPIVDAPAINESADTRILLDLCNYVILVVAYGKCTEEQIRNAALSIGKEKLLGVVLDRF